MRIEHLQTDLIIQIFSRLPSKSIARCRCVSKLWAFLLTLGSPYFTELFLTQSKTRPRLLFAVQRYDKWFLYSCPQPQILSTNSESSLSVTAEFHMSSPNFLDLHISFPVAIYGLIYCPDSQDNNGRKHSVLCNPSTGQILWLPKLKTNGSSRNVSSFFGYDPIDKQFSVLSISYPSEPSQQEWHTNYQILKMGFGKELFWRNLECPLQPHFPSHLYTYVNGVLYYLATFNSYFSCKIVRFGYISEEFKFIDGPWDCVGDCTPNVLVNFKGKLCAIRTEWVPSGERYNLELCLWILEDFERQEWSEHLYPLPSGLLCNKKYEDTLVYPVRVSVTGDIVLALICRRNNSFYVYFVNPVKNSLQEVEIKGFGELEASAVYAYVNYVEDLRIF